MTNNEMPCKTCLVLPICKNRIRNLGYFYITQECSIVDEYIRGDIYNREKEVSEFFGYELSEWALKDKLRLL